MRHLVRWMFVCFAAVVFAAQAYAQCPTAPTLVSPAHQSQQPFGSITLQWSSVASASDYQVFIGIDSDTPSLHAVTTTTTKTINVQPGRVITWYVVARANACQGASSSVRTRACWRSC